MEVDFDCSLNPPTLGDLKNDNNNFYQSDLVLAGLSTTLDSTFLPTYSHSHSKKKP